MLLRKILIEQLLSAPEGTELDLRNTPFFYILRANPLLAKFYADFLRRHNANPGLIKDLEARSGIFFKSGSIHQNRFHSARERSKSHAS